MNNLPENLFLKQIELGPLENFLYLLGDQKTRKMAVVDPAWDVDRLCQEAQQAGFTVDAVFLTHGHSDHVNGLKEILSRHDVPAYISRHEADFYKPKHKNIVEIKNGEKIKLGELEFETILVPGHTPGCQIFKYQNVLITGDALFIDGCGRCDLPGGDPVAMYHSLFDVIMKLPDEAVIFCGHNYGPVPYATLGEQKKTNPYLTCHSKEEFLQQRMGISF